MDIPKPPQDNELRTIIDKLAQFVARNGPEFEQMTKNKQTGNPKFAFLFGGEHYNYYQYKVSAEQGILKLSDGRGSESSQPPPPSPQNLAASTLSNMILNAVQGISQQSVNSMPNMSSLSNPAQAGLVAQWIVQQTQQQASQPPLPPPTHTLQPSIPSVDALTQQQSALQDQINQSEQNLNAQHLVLIHQEEAQVEVEIRKKELENLQKQADHLGVPLSDFDSILQPIMDSCTKDSISNGKTWLLNRGTNKEINKLLARYLLFKVLDEPEKKFFRKLHVIYLVNDILHHCVRKHIDGFKMALEEVVVPMFVNASLGVTEEQQSKLTKLLLIWEKKNHYFSDDIVSQLKDPSNSWENYKQKRMEDHQDIIDGLKLNTKNAVSTFQSQHLAFVTHAQQQIQALEQQKQSFIEQQKAVNQNSVPHNDHQKMSLSQPPPPPPPHLSYSDVKDDSMDANDWNRDRTGRHSSDGSPSRDSLRSQNESRSGGHDLIDHSIHDVDDRHLNMRDPRGSQDFGRHEPPPYDMPEHRDPRFENSRFDPRLDMPPGTGPPPNLGLELPININQPPPGFPGAPPADILLPDLTRPPPGFPPVADPAFQPEDLLPSLPYFDLPAGLMVPLIRLEDYSYKSLDPDAIRLPPPAPPSERLLAAVKAFYMPPRHENPRDSDGWEKLGLYEYFRAKAAAKKQKETEIDSGTRAKSRSPTPVRSWHEQAKSPPPKRRYSSRSRSKSRERDRNKRRRRERSRSPEPRSERRESRSERSDRDRDDRGRNDREREDRDRDDNRETRSPTPPSFMGVGSYPNPPSEDRLTETNKGHQLLKKMGWGGAGLGAKEQGIEQPISGGDVRDRQDQYKGVGINLNDPYENFRKSKGQAFINRMKARAEERAT